MMMIAEVTAEQYTRLGEGRQRDTSAISGEADLNGFINIHRRVGSALATAAGGCKELRSLRGAHARFFIDELTDVCMMYPRIRAVCFGMYDNGALEYQISRKCESVL